MTVAVTTVPTPHLDGRHCIFGKVVKGVEIVKEIESLASGSANQDRPKEPCIIADCGTYTHEEGQAVLKQ